MQQILNVDISKEKNYAIEISDCDFEKLSRDILDFTKNQNRLIVISKKVYKLYAKKLYFSDDEMLIMHDGEQEKNYKNYLKIIQAAIEHGLTRKDVIIAIGGGVVGDIAGFAASTYMRGIDFIQVPTTLLAAVDSSVGGKTAIDLDDAKNIIGTFYQPKKVFINTNFFHTLDDKQFKSGLGEVLKYALIENSCGFEAPLYLYEFLILGFDKVIKKEPATIIKIIELCLILKIAVVVSDEKESGLRKILNLGHTYGHALETLTKYKKYTHGEAVAYGLFFIFNWAYKMEYITSSYYKMTIELLEKYGFRQYKKNYFTKSIINIMKKDKKAKTGNIVFVVPCAKKQVKEIELSYKEVEKMFT